MATDHTSSGPAGLHAQARPSPWVSRFAGALPAGEVLDLACGGGRHVRLLAAQGRAVVAVDRDVSAFAQAKPGNVTVVQLDLEGDRAAWPPGLFAPDRYAGIVVTNYLHRPLLPLLLASLAAGAMLIYETFALGNERFGKPSNPDFLLRPGELLACVADTACRALDLRVVAFEEGQLGQPKAAMVQRICVSRGAASVMLD
ncbi:MAG: class I SAM-dependent methyltransferase [Janthinobacterium lividum]